MRIRHLHIENFKGIRELEISFLDADGRPRPITALLGDNGSGKTTVLQAIAFTLSLATGKTVSPAHFDWRGFLPERVGSRGLTRVALTIDLGREEAFRAAELWRWRQKMTYQPEERDYLEPGSLERLPQTPDDCLQLVVEYRNGTLQTTPDEALPYLWTAKLLRELFELGMRDLEIPAGPVGNVFWFQQQRDLPLPRAVEVGGIESLRPFLVGAWALHTSPRRNGGPDLIAELERHLQAVFPGTSIAGVAPRPGVATPRPEDFYFLFERDGSEYDLVEMASGEQAVFPLIFEFARQRIAGSVVLIDELELHLHPPEQQALLGHLRRLGPDCQFIITTHSPFLADVIPDEDEIRLPGGNRCL